MLIGGGRGSRGIVVRDNILHEVPLSVGYTAKDSQDCIVRGNVILRQGLSIRGFTSVIDQDNVVWRGRQGDLAPELPTAILRPSKYDPKRAHLAIVNRAKSGTVEVDLSEFLQADDAFRIQSVLDYYGQPVAQGRYEGKPVTIPMPVEQRTGQGEFCAFVVFRETKRRDAS
jgi:hypothetical protein